MKGGFSVFIKNEFIKKIKFYQVIDDKVINTWYAFCLLSFLKTG
jgi:hypothetical protein